MKQESLGALDQSKLSHISMGGRSYISVFLKTQYDFKQKSVNSLYAFLLLSKDIRKHRNGTKKSKLVICSDKKH